MRKGKSNETKSPQSDRGSGTQGVAQASSDLSIPAFLRREDTPESKAARERIAKQFQRGHARRVEKNSQSTISTGYAVPATDAAKAILREVLKSDASELQKDRARRALRKARGIEMSQAGPKEKALRETRANGDKRTKAQKLADACVTDLVKAPMNTPVSTPGTIAFGDAMAKLNGTKNGTKAEPTPASNASKPKKKEGTVKKKPEAATPAAKPAASHKAANGNGHARSTKAPSRMQMIEDMLLTKKGATQDQCNQAWSKSGGKSTHVSLKMQLERYKTRHPKAKLVEHDGHFRLEG